MMFTPIIIVALIATSPVLPWVVEQRLAALAFRAAAFQASPPSLRQTISNC
jgi:hypothetical protein